ncbi:hypothetical protein FHS35_005644 [Streptomyces umbrinus]|nr:hypothetical protein [Streptomyces umbrinus]
MGAFLVGQTRRAGDPGQNGLRGVASASLLQTAVVVHRDVRELGDLLAAQPRGPTT